MELKTNRLILREFQEYDFSAVHAYASNIDNVKYMIWGPNDEVDTTAFIKECMAWKYRSPRLHYDFAVTLKSTGQLIGGCGIYLVDDGLQAELGWILHKDYWKQGYMPEAAEAILAFGFEKLKLHRIYASCHADNYGSYRVMEKCGMRKEAHFIKNRRGREGIDDEWLDEMIYGILKSEWCERIV
ncbi:MAG TPA: GNAT family N-acetyltransferase [Clostridiales bacterium]|nr:GNAT family N-acetyltransferase [Clostridiales bacterium]